MEHFKQKIVNHDAKDIVKIRNSNVLHKNYNESILQEPNVNKMKQTLRTTDTCFPIDPRSE